MNDEDKVLNRMGSALMLLVLVIGLVFFLAGFRFINPADTAFHIVGGGLSVFGSGRYLWKRWRDWRHA